VRLNATIGQLLELFGRYQHLETLEVVDADGRGCGLIHRDALPVPAYSRVNPLLHAACAKPPSCVHPRSGV
jgi:hypothetical protein